MLPGWIRTQTLWFGKKHFLVTQFKYKFKYSLNFNLVFTKWSSRTSFGVVKSLRLMEMIYVQFVRRDGTAQLATDVCLIYAT